MLDLVSCSCISKTPPLSQTILALPHTVTEVLLCHLEAMTGSR